MPNTLNKLMDRFRPARSRQRKPATNEQLVAALAAIDDNSPQLGAILEQLHDQFEVNVRIAVNIHSDDRTRLRACDRMAAMLDSVELIEMNRVEARERKARDEEQRKQ